MNPYQPPTTSEPYTPIWPVVVICVSSRLFFVAVVAGWVPFTSLWDVDFYPVRIAWYIFIAAAILATAIESIVGVMDHQWLQRHQNR